MSSYVLQIFFTPRLLHIDWWQLHPSIWLRPKTLESSMTAHCLSHHTSGSLGSSFHHRLSAGLFWYPLNCSHCFYHSDPPLIVLSQHRRQSGLKNIYIHLITSHLISNPPVVFILLGVKGKFLKMATVPTKCDSSFPLTLQI